MIPYGRQDITQADIAAVVEILRSDFLTQGMAVPAFELAASELTGAKFAIAANSATSALHIACLALDLGKGDRLWTVPNTFVASANCGRYCGAEIDFVDIDPATWNISVSLLRDKLIRAKREGRLPKVLVPVHFAGQPTEQEKIWGLAKEFGFRVLEDASHAIGASRNGEMAGSCRWSDITIFSFHPVKIITTGEGGMALTNDESLAEQMRMLRSHGITRDPGRFQAKGGELMDGASPVYPAWYYEQQMLGYNYRMTDIQAGLGLSQIKRLGDYIQRRNQLAQDYNSRLRDLPLQLPTILQENISAFHLYVVRLMKDFNKKSHRQVFDEMRSQGVGVNLHYMPVHLQPYYRALGFAEGMYPESEAYSREAITLPLFPSLTVQAQDHVVATLKRVMGNG